MMTLKCHILDKFRCRLYLISFGILGPIVVSLKMENGVLLIYTLEGVSSVANFIAVYAESQ